MIRYLPGVILAIFGAGAYTIGCLLFMADRRQRLADARNSPAAANDNTGSSRRNRTMFIYAVAMMILGILALGAGLYALEVTEMHGLRG